MSTDSTQRHSSAMQLWRSLLGGCRRCSVASIFRESRTPGSMLNGFVVLSLAQVGFLGAGYVSNVCLARLLGPADYGTYGVVISIVVWAETFSTSGLVMAAHKTISEHPKSMVDIVWRFGRYVFVLTSILVGATIIAAPTIASGLGESRIALLLCVASIDQLFFGQYRLTAVAQSGLRRFHADAAIYLGYSLAKMVAIIFAVWAGFGILGGVVGNIIGSVLGLTIGIYFCRQAALRNVARRPDSVDFHRAFQTVPAITIGSLGQALYTSADLWIVKAYAGAAMAGQYFAALAIAKLAFVLTLPLHTVVLPFVCEATRRGSIAEAKDFIQQILVLFFAVLLPLIGTTIVFAEPIMKFVFSARYVDGSAILQCLALSYVLVSLAYALRTILISLARPWLACSIDVASALLSLPLYFWCILHFGALGAAYGLAGTALGVIAFTSFGIREVLKKC